MFILSVLRRFLWICQAPVQGILGPQGQMIKMEETCLIHTRYGLNQEESFLR